VSDAPVSVLCVDDDPGVLELTATCLEHASDRLDVTTETTVADGLDRVADSDVDCVVSDYEMPGTDGLAFLESVRSVRPDLPFVLFTGKGNEEVASEAVSTGVTDYIRKDGRNQYALLANRIENAVDRWRAERELARRSRAIDVVSDGVAILDDEGRYVEVNDAYAADYGLAPGAVEGRHWTAMAPSEEATRLREEALSAMRREGRWSGTAVGRRDDGSTFTRRLTLIGLDEGHLRITSSPGDDAGGAVERSADAVDARGATGRRGRERERTSLAGSAGTAWAAVDADRATLTIAADRSLRADPPGCAACWSCCSRRRSKTAPRGPTPLPTGARNRQSASRWGRPTTGSTSPPPDRASRSASDRSSATVRRIRATPPSGPSREPGAGR